MDHEHKLFESAEEVIREIVFGDVATQFLPATCLAAIRELGSERCAEIADRAVRTYCEEVGETVPDYLDERWPEYWQEFGRELSHRVHPASLDEESAWLQQRDALEDRHVRLDDEDYF